MVDLVETSLDDDKAEDITVIALAGKSSIAEYMVIASGRSSRQVGAMADHLAEKLKALGLGVTVEGKAAGDWVLLDAGDVVVHLFRPEVRAFYNLEKMWGVAPPARAMAPSAGSFAPTPA
ncbi:Iojap protein [Caenispirillum salinarum AK4]|uniref:Ribosomal silencing factor RsfS n=1 Tax=Caenispirillum salinarum AK4 TaxID=1238182 RepID=K9HQ39_9PROT|nr:ribosome silencing factor [Caenispirillum salinarum]EKV32413.1 Iojap protein [Caenispirillum salinarum AK4]